MNDRIGTDISKDRLDAFRLSDGLAGGLTAPASTVPLPVMARVGTSSQ